MTPAGDFRTSYREDTTIFPTRMSRYALWLGIALLCLAPLVLGRYELGLLITIGFSAIAALGLNILVGFTGQISIGHAAFFGFGAFASAWLHEYAHIPVAFCIPLAGLMCVPPEGVEPAPYFALLAKLANDHGLAPAAGGGLSMGMSGDFETAVMLGATHVRIGSALFGPRD